MKTIQLALLRCVAVGSRQVSRINQLWYNYSCRSFSNTSKCGSVSKSRTKSSSSELTICGQCFARDPVWFNIPDRVLGLTDARLHNRPNHPLSLIKRRIIDFILKRHPKRLIKPITYDRRHDSRIDDRDPDHDPLPEEPMFTIHDQLSPVVSVRQNFSNLLIPPDHPSRLASDTYYLNQSLLLRSHMTAHQFDLIQQGQDAFLMAGDVYRRDEIDAFHYPVFHQLDAVRLFTPHELFANAYDPALTLRLFDEPVSNGDLLVEAAKQHHFGILPSSMLPPDRQPRHTLETVKCLEFELKTLLRSMALAFFGPNVRMRWVDAYFPFTHPSWELEVATGTNDSDGEPHWSELLGCGIIRQELLDLAGVKDEKAGYAFGLGLERWAMQLYQLPDIRLFWSQDVGFLNQFRTDDIYTPITYKPVSIFPPCLMDMSFWLPSNASTSTIPSVHIQEPFKALERDFFDLVRSVGGDQIEQVLLVDEYCDPNDASRHSRCYRIVYRDQARTLTLDEVKRLHDQIGCLATERLGVKLR